MNKCHKIHRFPSPFSEQRSKLGCLRSKECAEHAWYLSLIHNVVYLMTAGHLDKVENPKGRLAEQSWSM